MPAILVPGEGARVGTRLGTLLTVETARLASRVAMVLPPVMILTRLAMIGARWLPGVYRVAGMVHL